jgi:ferric-dicitrate binding protein FerR (iron transport regulator)
MKVMNCREFQFHLDEYAAGRAKPEHRLALDAHRACCAKCEQAYRDEADLRLSLRAMPLEVPQHDLWFRVSAQIATPTPAARPMWRKWTFAAMVPAGCAALAFFLMTRQPVIPDPPRITVSSASDEQIVNNVLEMRRFEVAERDGLMEQNLP